MCLQAHNKPKNAHRLELSCAAFQYNPSSFTLFRLTWWQCVECAPFFLSDVPHAYLKNKMKKYQLNLKRI